MIVLEGLEVFFVVVVFFWRMVEVRSSFFLRVGVFVVGFLFL